MADRLTYATLTAIVARLQASSPSPWIFDAEQALVHSGGQVIAWFGAFNPTVQDTANVRFITHARDDIPALLNTLEGLVRELVSYAACKPPDVLCAWCGAQGGAVRDHAADCPVMRASVMLSG
jgi:hypothetical protein